MTAAEATNMAAEKEFKLNTKRLQKRYSYNLDQAWFTGKTIRQQIIIHVARSYQLRQKVIGENNCKGIKCRIRI